MKSRRWLGIGLIAVAVVVFIASSNFFVNAPEPEEFTFSFSTPCTVFAVILGLVGEVYLALSFRDKL